MAYSQDTPDPGFAFLDIPDPRPTADPLAALVEAEDRLTAQAAAGRLAAMISRLPRKEGLVIRLRFGFDEDPLRPGEIAARLGVCRKTVYNLQERGLTRLRDQLAGHRGRGPW